MISTAFPVVHNDINWPVLLATLKAGIEQDCSVDINARGISENAAFFSTIDRMCGSTLPPGQILQEAVWSLHHLSLTFLVICPPEVVYAFQETKLCVSSQQTVNVISRIAFISGTCFDWKQIITNPTSYESFHMRCVLNKVMDHIVSLGLRRIFSEYERKNKTDGTYILEMK